MLPPLRAWKGPVLLGFAVAFSSWLPAQSPSPLGSEFNLSGTLRGDQVAPAIALDSRGGYLGWEDNFIDGNGPGIGALRLDGNQNASGSPFRINVQVKGSQAQPSVALLSGGGAVFAWQTSGQGGSHIMARFLAADGGFLTDDVQVEPAFSRVVRSFTTNVMGYRANRLRKLAFRIQENTLEVRSQNEAPSAAGLSDGNALVVYSSARRKTINTKQIQTVVKPAGRRYLTNDLLQPLVLNENWGREIFFQRFSPTGQKLGNEVAVNQYTASDQRNPQVAVLPSGNFVVVWVSQHTAPSIFGNPGEVPISARIFDVNGQPLTDEFTVNSDPATCATPAVGAMSDGRFTVAWSQFNYQNVTNSWDIHARVFGSSGTPQGDSFRLNQYLPYRQFGPRIASIGNAQLVAWTSTVQDGSLEGVYGRALLGGNLAGDEFRINVKTASRQIDPVVASDGVDRFLAAWSSFSASGSFDVFARRYAAPEEATAIARASGSAVAKAVSASLPATLSAARSGDGKLEFAWKSVPGVSYQVQMSTNLHTWTDLGGPRSASSTTDSVSIETTLPAAFYRVILVP